VGRSSLGELEEQVLLVLVRLGGESGAAQVTEALSDTTGREVSPATTFMVMRRLERRGLLTSRRYAATVDGRLRRVYRIRPKLVLPQLRAARLARLALWTGLEGLLK
jgi:DNA-binding PadR family transcriptional regulator